MTNFGLALFFSHYLYNIIGGVYPLQGESDGFYRTFALGLDALGFFGYMTWDSINFLFFLFFIAMAMEGKRRTSYIDRETHIFSLFLLLNGTRMTGMGFAHLIYVIRYCMTYSI